jgi:DNA invertase Pin-like site-specific DNA recombinase
MENGKFVSYLRVSTARQGTSGLGLEAQRAAAAGFLNEGDWTLVQEVLEVESGSAMTGPPSLPPSSSAASIALPW